jgi:hypothetical protein
MKPNLKSWECTGQQEDRSAPLFLVSDSYQEQYGTIGKVKKKNCPATAMKAPRGRGAIANTHS